MIDNEKEIGMYNIENKVYEDTQPWKIPLAERIKSLLTAKSFGFEVAMYLYETPDSSTFRYRVYNIHQALELSLQWKSVYFFNNEMSAIEKYISDIDLLVIARFRWTFDLQTIIDIAKRYKKKVVFEIDDMVYHIKYISAVLNTLAVSPDEFNYNLWFSYLARLQTTAEQCQAALATNRFLADRMHDDLKVPTFVIQNFLNLAQQKASDELYNKKQSLSSENEFEIGYFSGSDTHYNDFMVAAPEIKQLLEKYDDIVLKLVGFMKLPPDFSDLEMKGRVKRVGMLNFIDLQSEMATSDVNIVPLVNNNFSNCKSELKFYEAAVVGTVTCATPSYVFKESIKNGFNGYLCENGQWFGTLEQIYLNRNEVNKTIARNAREYCMDKYAYSRQTEHIENTLDALVQI